MALDASIYGQLDTQAPLRLSQMIREANNPMAQAQQMLSLKQMLQQGKLQELQMQQAQAEMAQKAEDRAATRAALADFVAANPDMAQAARMSPQDAVKYFFDQMKAKNAPPDFIVAGDSVLQKPRTAGESLQPAYSVPGKPQLVERADPKDPLRTQKVWIRPGETDGPVAGSGTLPDILDSRVQEFQLRKARAGASSVNVGAPVLEREEDKAKGKLNVDAYGALRDSANASRTLNAHLDIQQRKLDNGFETGWGTEAKAAAAGMLGALGVKDAERYASDAQSFKAASMEVVLQKQLAQKGPQTESDALRIQQTGAQLGNTADANRFVIAVARAQNNRQIKQQRFFDDYWRKHSTYEGAEDAWYSGEGGKSLFDEPALQSTKAAPPGPKPGASANGFTLMGVRK